MPQWYCKAAEQGFADAQSNFGIMYDEGYGVPENDAEAVKWYRKSAEQGDVMAQNNLGIMYAMGTGVPVNNVKAHMWLSLAKAQGNELATIHLDIAQKQMPPAQIAEAQKLASEMWEIINN